MFRRYFYSLTYTYLDDKFDEHNFLIGYFSSIIKSSEAIRKLKSKPGFKDSNGAFTTTKFAVRFNYNVQDKDNLILFELSHEYFKDGYDYITILGIYATEAEAEANWAEMATRKPYSTHPEGFSIAKCKVDICGWSYGFEQW